MEAQASNVNLALADERLQSHEVNDCSNGHRPYACRQEEQVDVVAEHKEQRALFMAIAADLKLSGRPFSQLPESLQHDLVFFFKHALPSPPCDKCHDPTHVTFRYFNNRVKSRVLLQPRFSCKSPAHITRPSPNFSAMVNRTDPPAASGSNVDHNTNLTPLHHPQTPPAAADINGDQSMSLYSPASSAVITPNYAASATDEGLPRLVSPSSCAAKRPILNGGIITSNSPESTGYSTAIDEHNYDIEEEANHILVKKPLNQNMGHSKKMKKTQKQKQKHIAKQHLEDSRDIAVGSAGSGPAIAASARPGSAADHYYFTLKAQEYVNHVLAHGGLHYLLAQADESRAQPAPLCTKRGHGRRSSAPCPKRSKIQKGPSDAIHTSACAVLEHELLSGGSRNTTGSTVVSHRPLMDHNGGCGHAFDHHMISTTGATAGSISSYHQTAATRAPKQAAAATAKEEEEDYVVDMRTRPVGCADQCSSFAGYATSINNVNPLVQGIMPDIEDNDILDENLAMLADDIEAILLASEPEGELYIDPSMLEPEEHLDPTTKSSSWPIDSTDQHNIYINGPESLHEYNTVQADPQLSQIMGSDPPTATDQYGQYIEQQPAVVLQHADHDILSDHINIDNNIQAPQLDHHGYNENVVNIVREDRPAAAEILGNHPPADNNDAEERAIYENCFMKVEMEEIHQLMLSAEEMNMGLPSLDTVIGPPPPPSITPTSSYLTSLPDYRLNYSFIDEYDNDHIHDYTKINSIKQRRSLLHG